MLKCFWILLCLSLLILVASFLLYITGTRASKTTVNRLDRHRHTGMQLDNSQNILFVFWKRIIVANLGGTEKPRRREDSFELWLLHLEHHESDRSGKRIDPGDSGNWTVLLYEFCEENWHKRGEWLRYILADSPFYHDSHGWFFIN